MIPSIQFGFLICSYLPGIPLSLALYFFFLKPEIMAIDPKIGDSYFTPYLVIVPVIIGLFIDAIRHLITMIWRCIQEIIGLNYSEWTIFWTELPKEKMESNKSGYESEFFATLLSSSAVSYQVFEFFFNFSISTLFTTFILWSKSDSVCYLYKWIGLGVALLSFGFSQLFRKMHDSLILQRHFSSRFSGS